MVKSEDIFSVDLMKIPQIVKLLNDIKEIKSEKCIPFEELLIELKDIVNSIEPNENTSEGFLRLKKIVNNDNHSQIYNDIKSFDSNNSLIKIVNDISIDDLFNWRKVYINVITNEPEWNNIPELVKLHELLTSTEYTDTNNKISTNFTDRSVKIDNFITFEQCEDIVKYLATEKLFEDNLNYYHLKIGLYENLNIMSEDHCKFLLNKLRNNIDLTSEDWTSQKDVDLCIDSCILYLNGTAEDGNFLQILDLVLNMKDNSPYWIKRSIDISNYITDNISE